MVHAPPAIESGMLPDSILMVEDDPAMQARLARLLTELGCPAHTVTVAGSLAQAHDAIRKSSYSLALVDIGLPDGNGIDLIAEWRAAGNAVPAVILSAWSKPDLIIRAIRSGATGYLLKEREDVELLLSIRIIFRGGAPIDPFVAQFIIAALADPRPTPPPDALTLLSRRETTVLELIADGLSNQAIADQLFISRNTVESHIKSIYRKLEVPSRTNAINKARRHGLI